MHLRKIPLETTWLKNPHCFSHTLVKILPREKYLKHLNFYSLQIEQARVGNRLSAISQAIQSWVERHGFSVVRDFVGHGIGTALHEEPQIPNFGTPLPNPRLQEGMVFAIEPMVNEGSYEMRILPDGWTAVTADGKLSAHFEHTIAITGNGPVILTER